MYKIVFFGTSEFAVPSLKALMDDGRFEILGVVTQPDRPVGRHAVLTPPAVKLEIPAQAGIQILQPEKLKDESFQTWIKGVGPECDAFVIISYGKILPQWLLDLPKHGVINVHGSLLPRWRGASPIQAAIAAGDEKSGITIMQLDAYMDHGSIIRQIEEPIHADDIGSTLHDRLAESSGKYLPDILSDFLDGKIQPREQDHTAATYCQTLAREDGKLDFTKTATQLERLIRAYNPWPGTWMDFDGQRLKIISARIGAEDNAKSAGQKFSRDNTPCLACANGTILEITQLQPEGKSAMTGAEFLRGKRNWE